MYRFCLLAFVAVSSAVDTCPEVNPVDNFDFPAFGNGKWYEVARYINSKERDSNCGTAEYTLSGDWSKVRNSYVVKNKEHFIEGTFKVAPDAGKKGKLVFTMPYGRGGTNVETYLDVLAVDYNKYAITYFCKYIEATKTYKDFAWILSRSKTLDEDTKAEIEGFVKSSSILDNSRIKWPLFTEDACRIDV